MGELGLHQCCIAPACGAREHLRRMAFTVNRLGPQFANGDFAAEFLGANLHEAPTDELVDAFEEAMARYAVVVLRDQLIDDGEQVRFARAFGAL